MWASVFVVLALVSSVESTLNNGGKFILRPYLDIPELASAVSEIEPGRFRASVLHRVSEGHTVTLDYDVKHAEKTHSIHFDMDGLEDIVCGRDTVLVLRFVDEVYANKCVSSVKESHHIVGSYACDESNPHADVAILRRVLALRVEGRVVTVKTLPLSLAQVFQQANITFHTTALQSVHTAPADPTPKEAFAAVSSKKTRGFGSWLSSTWGSVEHLAGDVGKVIGNVAHDVLSLVGGDLTVNQQWTKSLIDYNFNSATNRAKGPISFQAGVSCTNCYAKFDAGLHFGLAIDNYKLQTMDLTTFGTAKVGMGANAAVVGDIHVKLDAGTFQVPRITFVVSGIPVTIKFTVPVSLGFDATATVKSLSNADMYGEGDLRFGVKYENGALKPYTTHSIGFHGVVYKGISGEVHATAWVQPIVVMDVNFLGGPSFALRPYGEAIFQTSNGKCQSGSVSSTINAGLQGVLGAQLDLKVAGHDLYKKTMNPATVLSQMYPILSGCYLSNSVVSFDSLQSNITNVTAVPFLEGAVWHGTQTLVNFTNPMCEAMYPHSVDYSLQLVSINDLNEAVFVLAGNAMDLVQNDTVPGYCCFSQLMAGTIDPVAKTLKLSELLSSANGVNYFECSDDEFPVKASLQNFLWMTSPFHLVGIHPDQCLTSFLDAPDQQTLDKNLRTYALRT